MGNTVMQVASRIVDPSPDIRAVETCRAVFFLHFDFNTQTTWANEREIEPRARVGRCLHDRECLRRRAHLQSARIGELSRVRCLTHDDVLNSKRRSVLQVPVLVNTVGPFNNPAETYPVRDALILHILAPSGLVTVLRLAVLRAQTHGRSGRGLGSDARRRSEVRFTHSAHNSLFSRAGEHRCMKIGRAHV